MIAFVAVHWRSVCRLTCVFEPRRMMRNWREHGQLQPQLQPVRFHAESPMTTDARSDATSQPPSPKHSGMVQQASGPVLR
jgi:hypothetical protein